MITRAKVTFAINIWFYNDPTEHLVTTLPTFAKGYYYRNMSFRYFVIGERQIIYFICGRIHQQKLAANFPIKQVNSFSQCVTAT